MCTDSLLASASFRTMVNQWSWWFGSSDWYSNHLWPYKIGNRFEVFFMITVMMDAFFIEREVTHTLHCYACNGRICYGKTTLMLESKPSIPLWLYQRFTKCLSMVQRIRYKVWQLPVSMDHDQNKIVSQPKFTTRSDVVLTDCRCNKHCCWAPQSWTQA